MKILESEVSLHDTSSFDSGSQHVLLGGDVGAAGYPVQVVQVTVGGARSRHKTRFSREWTGSVVSVHVLERRDSLSGRVVELVLSGATETGLDSSVLPQPLDDPGQLARHEPLLG